MNCISHRLFIVDVQLAPKSSNVPKKEKGKKKQNRHLREKVCFTVLSRIFPRSLMVIDVHKD